MDIQTIDRQIDRQIDGQIDIQIDRLTLNRDRIIEGQINRNKYSSRLKSYQIDRIDINIQTPRYSKQFYN